MKHHIPIGDWAAMRIVGKEMELPPMDANPFSTLPLEANDSDLLVGRQHMLTVLSQYMVFRSPRRILVLGDHGSGRTSLLRCASKTAPLVIYIDHISHSNAGLHLLKELYSHFVHSNPPEGRNMLTEQILSATHQYTDALPLIVLDASTVDISALNVALRDTLPFLERLEVVIAVVLETKDRNLLPASILQRLEQLDPLPNLSAEEVQLLIERRIEKSTKKAFSFDKEDAQHLFEQTGGVPAEVIRVMRDAIDSAKMSQLTNLQPTYNPSTPVSEPQFMPPGEESTIHPTFESMLATADEHSTLEQQSAEVEDHVQKEANVMRLQEVQDAKIMESIEDVSNMFDLDLDQLTEDQENQEELKILEALDDYQDGYPATPPQAKPEPIQRPPLDPIATKGMTGLFRRNRTYIDKGHAEHDNDEQTLEQLVESTEGAELWVDPSLKPAEPVEEVVSEDDSAYLMHDEIGFFDSLEVEDEDSEPLSAPRIPSNVMNDPISTSNGLLGELAGMVPVMKALQQVLLSPNGQQSTHNRRQLVDALEALQRTPVTEKHDFPLNATLLSALTSHEITVISVANERRYSPSDSELLTLLNIKRARLSQISNRLLKGGILSVRTLGRNRYFELTQAARAQLIAWKVIGGDV